MQRISIILTPKRFSEICFPDVQATSALGLALEGVVGRRHLGTREDFFKSGVCLTQSCLA